MSNFWGAVQVFIQQQDFHFTLGYRRELPQLTLTFYSR